ncbi:transmembrane protein 71 isoform X2 [Sciurus carolinensis]|uniref:transmembrane protein 71 isoform X2 n=1 Tax=Sciurus carolinensis TaxID=30640 RepID=UPI001FB2E4AF|nr:transmembrane protein 71 isoform X2 [Sciurus carolinensis]
MYRISQLMSTPVASSSRWDRECTAELSPSCLFPSLARHFLDGGGPLECCSVDPLTGYPHTCRRSPRLLTNGYYVWTEDSFLCDEDGNVTLNPSQTTVSYKENLVRIFRKKRRVRRSLPSLFSLSASQSWLCGSVLGDADACPDEDVWLEGGRRPDVYHCGGDGGDFDCSSLTDNWNPKKPNAASVKASSSSQITSRPPGGGSQDSLQSPGKAPGCFQENIADRSQTSLLREVSFQAILLTACLIISLCTRWCTGGVVAHLFTCTLVITIAYVVKSLFLSLTSYFQAPACARFAKI